MKKVITTLVTCLILCAIMFQTAHAEYVGRDDSAQQTASPPQTVPDSSAPTNPGTQSPVDYPSSIDSWEEAVEYMSNTSLVDQPQTDSALNCVIWLTDPSGRLVSELYPGQNYVVNIQFDAYADATGAKVWLSTNLLNAGAPLNPNEVGLIGCSWRTDEEPQHRTTLSVGLIGDTPLRMKYVQNSAILNNCHGASFSIPDEELFAVGVRLGDRVMNGEIAQGEDCRLSFTMKTEPASFVAKSEDSVADSVPSASAELTLQRLDDRISQMGRSIQYDLDIEGASLMRQVNGLRSEFESQRRHDTHIFIIVVTLLLAGLIQQQFKIKKLENRYKIQTDIIDVILGELHHENAVKEERDSRPGAEDQASEADTTDACCSRVGINLMEDDVEKTPTQLIQEAERLLEMGSMAASDDGEDPFDTD